MLSGTPMRPQTTNVHLWGDSCGPAANAVQNSLAEGAAVPTDAAIPAPVITVKGCWGASVSAAAAGRRGGAAGRAAARSHHGWALVSTTHRTRLAAAEASGDGDAGGGGE